MKKVYKYKLPIIPGPFELLAPLEFEPLKVVVQRDVAYLYALVDVSTVDYSHKFFTFMTGDSGVTGIWMGTAEFPADLHGGVFVLHYFEHFEA